MICSRFAVRLLARIDVSASREALVGDLLEEIALGRSQWWLCQQLIGLYGLALAAHARRRARPTPFAVALALSALLLGGASFTSVNRMVEAWLVFYLLAGTVSLFAHMAARAHVSARL